MFEETVEYKWGDRNGLIDYIDSDLAIQSHNNRYKKYFDVFNTLYVSNLDGTLMKNDKSISEKSVNIINDLLEKGITFTVATARSLGIDKYIDEREVPKKKAYIKKLRKIGYKGKIA